MWKEKESDGRVTSALKLVALLSVIAVTSTLLSYMFAGNETRGTCTSISLVTSVSPPGLAYSTGVRPCLGPEGKKIDPLP